MGPGHSLLVGGAVVIAIRRPFWLMTALAMLSLLPR